MIKPLKVSNPGFKNCVALIIHTKSGIKCGIMKSPLLRNIPPVSLVWVSVRTFPPLSALKKVPPGPALTVNSSHHPFPEWP